jgi:hypothetical protein
MVVRIGTGGRNTRADPQLITRKPAEFQRFVHVSTRIAQGPDVEVLTQANERCAGASGVHTPLGCTPQRGAHRIRCSQT